MTFASQCGYHQRLVDAVDRQRRKRKWALKKARLYTDCSEHYADERDTFKTRVAELVRALRDIAGKQLTIAQMRAIAKYQLAKDVPDSQLRPLSELLDRIEEER